MSDPTDAATASTGSADHGAPFSTDLLTRAADLLAAARAREATILTVESCTGGLLAGVLTAIAGSSDVVEGGFVTYSNAMKVQIGVPPALLCEHGAVSEAVARAMAEAGRARMPSRHALAITGVAGPGGGSDQKPVGLVHLAAASARGVEHRALTLGPIGRDAIRLASVSDALELLRQSVNT